MIPTSIPHLALALRHIFVGVLSDVSERDAQYQLSKAQALLQNPELGEEVPIIKPEDFDASSSDYSQP